MATHSSVLAWRIPGTGEPGGLPSMGSHGVRHDWSDLVAAAAAAACQMYEIFHVKHVHTGRKIEYELNEYLPFFETVQRLFISNMLCIFVNRYTFITWRVKMSRRTDTNNSKKQNKTLQKYNIWHLYNAKWYNVLGIKRWLLLLLLSHFGRVQLCVTP